MNKTSIKLFVKTLYKNINLTYLLSCFIIFCVSIFSCFIGAVVCVLALVIGVCEFVKYFFGFGISIKLLKIIKKLFK